MFARTEAAIDALRLPLPAQVTNHTNSKVVVSLVVPDWTDPFAAAGTNKQRVFTVSLNMLHSCRLKRWHLRHAFADWCVLHCLGSHSVCRSLRRSSAITVTCCIVPQESSACNGMLCIHPVGCCTCPLPCRPFQSPWSCARRPQAHSGLLSGLLGTASTTARWVSGAVQR